MLVEIETAGSRIVPYVTWEWMQRIIANYLVWKLRNRVNRWARYKSAKKRNS